MFYLLRYVYIGALIFMSSLFSLGYGMSWSESAIMSSSEASSMFWSSFCRKTGDLTFLLEMERPYWLLCLLFSLWGLLGGHFFWQRDWFSAGLLGQPLYPEGEGGQWGVRGNVCMHTHLNSWCRHGYISAPTRLKLTPVGGATTRGGGECWRKQNRRTRDQFKKTSGCLLPDGCWEIEANTAYAMEKLALQCE